MCPVETATHAIIAIQTFGTDKVADPFHGPNPLEVYLPGHFDTVGQLDSGVCRIMHAIASSDLGRHHPLTHLFDAIKRDEANHVGVSRRCARELGASPSKEREIARRLVAFLTPDAHHFEAIGVCPDRLFRRIAGASS